MAREKKENIRGMEKDMDGIVIKDMAKDMMDTKGMDMEIVDLRDMVKDMGSMEMDGVQTMGKEDGKGCVGSATRRATKRVSVQAWT